MLIRQLLREAEGRQSRGRHRAAARALALPLFPTLPPLPEQSASQEGARANAPLPAPAAAAASPPLAPVKGRFAFVALFPTL